MIDWLADRATPCLPVSCQATTRPVPEWASAATAAWCVEGQGSIARLLLRAVHGGGSGESPPDVCGPAEGRGVSPVLMRCRRRRGQSLSSGRVVCVPWRASGPGLGASHPERARSSPDRDPDPDPDPDPGGGGTPAQARARSESQMGPQLPRVVTLGLSVYSSDSALLARGSHPDEPDTPTAETLFAYNSVRPSSVAISGCVPKAMRRPRTSPAIHEDRHHTATETAVQR